MGFAFSLNPPGLDIILPPSSAQRQANLAASTASASRRGRTVEARERPVAERARHQARQPGTPNTAKDSFFVVRPHRLALARLSP